MADDYPLEPVLPGGKPYDRLEGETNKAYRAFQVYRDLGLGRTVHEVSLRVSPTSRVQPSPHLQHWCAKYSWVKRAKMYDSDMELREREAMLKEVVEMRRRHAKAAQAMQYKATERLATLDPKEMQVGDVLKFFIESAKLERLSLGEPDTKQRIEHSGPDGAPIQIQPVTVQETVIRSRDELKAIKDSSDAEILE